MMRINLLPPEISKAKTQKRQVELIVGAVILVLALLVLVYAAKLRRLSAVEKDIVKTEAELQTQSAIVSQVEILQAKQTVLSRRRDVIRQLVKDQFTWVQILDEINDTLPKEVWITSLTSSEAGVQKALTFTGVAFNNFAVADFITYLDNSKRFTEIELGSLTEGPEVDKVKTMQFVISCRTKI
jgi:Tfp pilus assembly protein PilN